MHLKVRVYRDEFEDAMDTWSNKRRKIVHSLKEYARNLRDDDSDDDSD